MSQNKSTSAMFGARAARIAQSSAASSSTPSAGSTRRRRNAPEWILHKWRQVAMKLFLVLNVFSLKNSALTVLGRDTYNRILHRQRTIEEQAASPNQATRRVHRMIRGEAVGKELQKKGAGTPLVDPAMCDHPAESMKRQANDNRRSGGGMKWWTCERCKTRWERLPCGVDRIPQETTIPKDTDILTAGKYMGHTYQNVYTQDWEYCQWILQTSSQEQELPWVNHFAVYLMTLMNQMEEDHQSPAFPDYMGEDLVTILEEEDPLL